MVKRIRGVTFSTRVSVQLENTAIHSARGIFNRLLPDVHIFTDHRVGPHAGKYAMDFCLKFAFTRTLSTIILKTFVVPMFSTNLFLEIILSQIPRLWNVASCRNYFWVLHIH